MREMKVPETIEKLYKICEGLNIRFPGNEDPFRILARLMEESGELAQETHHFEGIGRKRKVRPESPNKDHLAKECMDVITAVLHVATLYGVQGELNARIDKHYSMVIEEGLVEPCRDTEPGA